MPAIPFSGDKPIGIHNPWRVLLGATPASNWYWVYRLCSKLAWDQSPETPERIWGTRAPLAFLHIRIDFFLKLVVMVSVVALFILSVLKTTLWVELQPLSTGLRCLPRRNFSFGLRTCVVNILMLINTSIILLYKMLHPHGGWLFHKQSTSDQITNKIIMGIHSVFRCRCV